jgi:hypothetical protein
MNRKMQLIAEKYLPKFSVDQLMRCYLVLQEVAKKESGKEQPQWEDTNFHNAKRLKPSPTPSFFQGWSHPPSMTNSTPEQPPMSLLPFPSIADGMAVNPLRYTSTPAPQGPYGPSTNNNRYPPLVPMRMPVGMVPGFTPYPTGANSEFYAMMQQASNNGVLRSNNPPLNKLSSSHLSGDLFSPGREVLLRWQ